jgi:hypothetical protein
MTNKAVRSIGAALALTIALGLAPLAYASRTGQDEHNRSRTGQDEHGRWTRAHMTRYAYALGYNRGYDDAAQGSYRNYREVQRWREGTEGWENPMGTRTTFRDNFRKGFSRGFMDARSNHPRRYSQSDVDRIRAEVNEDREHRRP